MDAKGNASLHFQWAYVPICLPLSLEYKNAGAVIGSIAERPDWEKYAVNENTTHHLLFLYYVCFVGFS